MSKLSPREVQQNDCAWNKGVALEHPDGIGEYLTPGPRLKPGEQVPGEIAALAEGFRQALTVPEPSASFVPQELSCETEAERREVRERILTEHARRTPVSRMGMNELSLLMHHHPEEGALAWTEALNDAWNELIGGHRAFAPIARAGANSVKDRARFAVLRQSLASEWEPRNGIEWALIDQMAQTLTWQEYWQGVLAERTLAEPEEIKRMEVDSIRRGWSLPRQSRIEAIEHATAQADRFNRMFLRQVRALRDMRRYTVNIVAPGQVNIGEKQVNVTK